GAEREPGRRLRLADDLVLEVVHRPRRPPVGVRGLPEREDPFVDRAQLLGGRPRGARLEAPGRDDEERPLARRRRPLRGGESPGPAVRAWSACSSGPSRDGRTPMTVYGTPSKRTVRPTASARPPRRSIQKRWLTSVVFGAPGLPSASVKSRPSAGGRPSS